MLERGFAIVRDGAGEVLTAAAAARAAAALEVEFADGRVRARPERAGAGAAAGAGAGAGDAALRLQLPTFGPGQGRGVSSRRLSSRTKPVACPALDELGGEAARPVLEAPALGVAALLRSGSRSPPAAAHQTPSAQVPSA